MMRYMIMIITVSASAVAWAGFMASNPDLVDQVARTARDGVRVQRNEAQARQEMAEPVSISGIERIRADSRGHHVTDVQVNNRRITGLIDTGATAVAINESMARDAGIRLSPADFIYEVSTANGAARAARATIREMRIGTIRISNVDALVLEDRALDVMLVGMSFLKRLRSFSIERGELVMKR